VGWDDRSQRYVVSALLPGRQPSVRRAGDLGGPGPGVEVDPFYTGAYTLAGRRTGTRLRAGAVSAFRVVAGGRVVAARATEGHGPARVAVTVYRLDMSRGATKPGLMRTGSRGIVSILPMRHRSAARVLKEEGARFARAAIGGGSVNGTCLL